MANTPQVPKKPQLVVVPSPKKEREATMTFDTGSGKPLREIPVGTPPDPREDDTERTTLVDPPTDRHDPVPATRGSSDPLYNDEIAALLALPARTFRAKEMILDTEALLGYYVILSGTAEETAVSSKGEPDADPIMLGSKDVIGINRDVRVVAQTDVRVAIVMLADLAEKNPLLHRRATEILFEAAMKNSAALRNRLVLAQEELKIQREAFDAVERLRQEEHSTFLHERDEKIIDNTRLARRIKTLDRELNERVKELMSLMTILQLYRDQIEETEEIVTERTEQLNELRERFRRLAVLAPLFELAIASGKPEWTKVGQDGLTLLYTFGARLKSDPTKNPPHGG